MACLREHSKRQGLDLNSSPSDSDAISMTTQEWTFGKEEHQRSPPCFMSGS